MPSLCSKRNVTSASGRPLLKSIVFTAEVALNMDARYGADVLSGNNEPCHPRSIDANINTSLRRTFYAAAEDAFPQNFTPHSSYSSVRPRRGSSAAKGNGEGRSRFAGEGRARRVGFPKFLPRLLGHTHSAADNFMLNSAALLRAGAVTQHNSLLLQYRCSKWQEGASAMMRILLARRRSC